MAGGTTGTGDLLEKAAQVAKELGMKDEKEEKGEKEEQESEEVEDETTQEDTQEEEEETEEETESVKSVPYKRFAEVYGRYKELERLIPALLAQQQRPKEDNRETKKVELPDFDTMTQSETVKWTLGAVAQMLDQKLSQTITPLQREAQVKDAMADIEATSGKYADFWKHYDKMHAMAAQHPTLNAEQLYLLASGNKKALTRSIVDGLKDQVNKKKAARTETRSASSGKQTEVKSYKTTRDAALDIAKKLGMT